MGFPVFLLDSRSFSRLRVRIPVVRSLWGHMTSLLDMRD
jgi:hypothetical protein